MHDDDGHGGPRHRASILSDALGLRRKLGSVSRKKHGSVAHMPAVIEITAQAPAHRDCEHEERGRLRDAAAHSIGLDPELHHPRPVHDAPRAVCIPPFPATLAALQPFMELSATLPKFTPPASLLSYALARQWKPRTIVLTSHPVSRRTHVHLFKAVARDDREVERLEVTENSVIFVANESVGGRGNVVKFAAKDVSAKRTPPADTMWLLQMTDPVESQRWIAAVKNAVLTHRAVRAGLDIPTQRSAANEPKGDMDVMLSMHLQRLVSPAPPPLVPPKLASPPPSLRSLKISIPSSPGVFPGSRPRSPSVDGSPSFPSEHTEGSFGGAGTSLLSMLRTKSSADSTASPPHSLPLQHVQGRGSPAPSLRSVHAPVMLTASDLKISKDRDAPELSVVIPDISATTPNTPPTLPGPGTFTLSLQPPPRKSKQPVPPIPTFLPVQHTMYKQTGGNRSVAGNFGVPSRATDDVASGQTSPTSPDSSSLLAGQPASLSSGSGALSGNGEAHAGEQGDATSIQIANGPSSPGSGSVVLPSADKGLPGATFKRWSRQGIPLPKQPTPPSGPPPSAPPSPENNRRVSVGSSVSVSFTYAVDRPPSSSSSNSHCQPRITPRSGTSLSPTFWRRASGSSAYSAVSTLADPPGRDQVPGSFKGTDSSLSLRSAAPNSNGTSSRPMSLSVLGPSPVASVGTSKRRSMPPPRPAPTFAPPPAPPVLETASITTPPSTPQKLFRSSVAQRALRRSLTSPKPPPSSALPPRPDEAAFTHGHRRSSSAGTPNVHGALAGATSRPPSVLSGTTTPTPTPTRNMSIRQRLRILSTPPASPTPAIQVSTLDLSDDNEDELRTPPYPDAHAHALGLGEPILASHDPSFLRLEAPETPTLPKPPPPPRSPFRPMPPSSSSVAEPLAVELEQDHGFVALSPPPPRRGSKPLVSAPAAKHDEREDGPLSHRNSIISLGFGAV